MANKAKNDNNVLLAMAKVFGDRLNGLSEAEMEFVQAQIVDKLDDYAKQAKERAAWADVVSDIAEVFVIHNKANVVAGKGFRIVFDDEGSVEAWAVYTPRGSTTSTDGKVKQYRKAGSDDAWETATTWKAACDAHSLPLNGASGKAVLEKAGYETRYQGS